MTPEQQDASAGYTLAKQLLQARLDGSDADVLRLLNDGTEGEVRWALGVVVAAFEETTVRLTRGDRRKARRALRAGLSALDGDAVMTQVGLILRDAERGMNHG